MPKKNGPRAGNRQRRSSLPIPGSSEAKVSKTKASSSSNGSGNSKKSAPKIAAPQDEPRAPSPSVSDEATTARQQLALNVFKSTFGAVLSSPSFSSTLQSVKQALFDRDFARAFASNEYLEVYAARYSPTRALCYASVLAGIHHHLYAISSEPGQEDDGPAPRSPSAPSPLPRTLRHLSIGGGAAETVAFAAYLKDIQSTTPMRGTMHLLDSAAWGTVVSSLTNTLTTPSHLSSSSSEDSDTPFIPPSLFQATFTQQDAFSQSRSTLRHLLNPPCTTATKTTPKQKQKQKPIPILTTLLFTLNELFTAGGIGKTTRLLLDLTSEIPIGSLLLVVDSPGSYSETAVGKGNASANEKEAKRSYPMKWLLDRIMLGTRTEPVNGRMWRKLESCDSVWFRFLSGTSTGLLSGLGSGTTTGTVEYPIPLENMRYQMHLYVAEAAADGDGDGDEEEQG